ncbi:MAG TPA: tRNA (adenosine(37)-N6)-dimethylallyltransferase MiaA, partial [Mesorhizobium sp.]
LIEGISEMPEIPASVRDRWRYELREQGSARLHRILMENDASAAMTLRASDGQRIVRALEVMEASGRSILDWQAAGGQPLVDLASAQLLVLEPDRPDLVQRIERRFERMMENDALQEVRALCALDLDRALPAMKAIGVRELKAAMDGETSFAEAIERAKIATRQYAKRQSTWFRHQFDVKWQRFRSADQVRI